VAERLRHNFLQYKQLRSSTPILGAGKQSQFSPSETTGMGLLTGGRGE
jgi:hypothetical protein